MTGLFLSFNWMTFLMVVVTIILVANNRAFSRVIRLLFQVSLILSLYLSVFSQHISYRKVSPGVFVYNLLIVSEYTFRPLIFFLLVYLFIKLKRDRVDYFFSVVMFVIVAVAVATENLLGEFNVINDTLCVVVCIFYYYWVMQTYKKDNLTRLPIRHNLNYEMEDIINRKYDVVLIDVDNFKLINDKYGHEKGDETLVHVVNAIKKVLLRGCSLYRYGGDEFIIISKRVSEDELIESLEMANEKLAQKDLHFSYGIATHNAGEDSSIAISKADEIMYDNKKELKGDGIWDSMTGLYNYGGFLAELNNFRKVIENDKKNLCLFAVDIERLNNIIMAYGYVEGNFVIKVISQILDAAVVGNGFAGHLSADEFVVALEVESDNDMLAIDYIDRVNEAIAQESAFEDKDYTIKLNIGKLYVDIHNNSMPEELVNDVLYVKQEVKDNKNKHELFDADQEYDEEEEKLVMDILDNNRLRYAFQPIVSAKDGEIVAYESLMRSDTEQMVSPLAIIKYAEKNKRLYDVEKYTFFNVFDRIINGGDLPENTRIFVNSIPGYMLTDEDYNELIGRYREMFSRLVVEITEQREVDDNALSTINMRRDRDGYNLAIDDYGSGYSNTNSLLRYMPQVIKLDRLLITGIERNAKKQFFVDSIISFAKDNDMKTLAEGVETESELKTVIRLGVDMIQGYFTAKPAFEIVEEIPAEVKRIIVDENLKVGSNKRMVYTAPDNCELSSVRLAMEDYSKINVSAEFIRIVGSKDYASDLVIKIKDGANVHMTLCDVCLNSVDSEPCIEVGEGAHLTLNLEGNNRLNSKGIHVPDGSSIKVIGMGNLVIFSKGHECYGIGSDSESGFGNIIMNSTGLINVIVDGERCVGIGGGIVKDNSAIDIISGSYDIQIAGVDAVGLGAYEGNVPIIVRDCLLNANVRVNMGIVIGSWNGVQDITIKNFNVNIVGSGTKVSAIGSINESEGNISFEAGECKIKLNGQKLHLVGCSEGPLSITSSHVKFEMIGEGDNVIGFGSFDETASLKVNETSLELVINASSPRGFGLAHQETQIGFRGPLTIAKINGVTRVLGEEV